MNTRIAFLKSRLSQIGGLEKYTHFLLRAFVKKGCEVTLLTTGDAPEIEGVHSISLAPHSKFTFYQISHFDQLCQNWLQNNPQEIVFGMERNTFQTHYRAGNGVHAVYLSRRKLVDSALKCLTFRLNPLHRKLLSMEKRAFEHPDLQVLFTNSHMVRDEILNTYSTPLEKLVVVHNGVEWEKWSSDFELSLFQKKEKPFQFLFVGNGFRRKGLLFLLKGLREIRKEEFQLLVVGKDRELNFFLRSTEKLGLKEKVVFLGPQKDIKPFYQSADALVIPSIYDPFANVTVEALAMGLFVVSSEYNGGKEVLQTFSGEIIQDLTAPKSVAFSLKKDISHFIADKHEHLILSYIPRYLKPGENMLSK